MPIVGFTYHRPLTDSNSTTLSNFVVRVDLTSANFDFTLCRSDGADFRVRDETAGALVPMWLSDIDVAAQTARLFYLATATANSHFLYFGSASASSVSNFANVFIHGSGFDTNFGDLTTVVGSNGYASQVPASTSVNDSRNYRVWSIAENATLKYSDTGFSDGGYTGVREASLIRDAVTNKPLLIGGKYYITFARRSPVTADKIDSVIASSTSQNGPWSNFVKFYSPPTTPDIRLGYPSSCIKVGSTYVLHIGYGWSTTGTQTPGLTIYTMTSTDLSTWTPPVQALAPSIWTDPISSTPCTDAGNAWVIRCADGVYMMVLEAQDIANNIWACYGATATDPINGPWTALNSGAPLLSKGAGGTWDFNGDANPKVYQQADGTYVIPFNGSDNSNNLDADWQLGFATASARGGPYTKATYNPTAGRPTLSYGVEAAAFHPDVDGTLFNWVQRYGDDPTGSSQARIFKLAPQLKRGGLLVSPTPTDSAAMGVSLATGNFTAESRSILTAHRSATSAPFLLALWDYASMPAAAASATFNLQRRLEISRWSHDIVQNFPSTQGPGDITFMYRDATDVPHYWNGTQWVTSSTGRNLPADHGREVMARISDDGTSFILTATYADDGSLIATATIGKSTVKAFSSGRLLFAGDLFSDVWASGLYFRNLRVRAYAVTEPAILVGGQTQDQARLFTLAGPSPSTGPVGIPSAAFTVTPDATYTGTITLTPSGGGLSAPIVLTFSSASSQTFTITPTLAGTVTLTATNSGGLINPSPVTYTATSLVSTTTLFPIITYAFDASRASLMGYTVYSLTGTVVTARAAAGIARIGNAFVATAAVPRAGNFVVDWDDGTTHDAMLIADPIVDGTITSSQAQAISLAMDAGKSTDGGLTFYAPDGTTVRVTGTVSGSDRATSVLSPPT